MKQRTSAWIGVAATAIVALILAGPASAGQRGGTRGGRAGGSARPASGGSGHAVPKGGGTTTGATNAGTPTGGSSGVDGAATPSSSHPASGSTVVGHAVPPTPATGGTTVIIPNGFYGGFYPWGYAGLGFGGYYAGYYNPWFSGGYDGYAPPTSYSYGYDGSLRLKVKPREASVYVDGYYSGIVDDFDGVFQKLRVEAGPHHVEIQSDGYEPLAFDVQIEPGRTITYSGELRKTP